MIELYGISCPLPSSLHKHADVCIQQAWCILFESFFVDARPHNYMVDNNMKFF